MASRRSKVNSKKTQESLDSQTRKFDSQIDQKQSELENLTAEIQKLQKDLRTATDKGTRDRIEAKLKRKLAQRKRWENNLEQKRSMSFNSDQARINLQNAQDNKVIVKALKSGAKALKKQSKSLSLSEVEDVRDECDDLVQQSQAIQGTVSRPLYSLYQVDDDDEQLEEELARIMDEPDEEAPLNGNEEMLLSDTSPDVFDPQPSPACDQNKPEDGLNGDYNAGGDKKGRDGDRDPDFPGIGFIPIPFVLPIPAVIPPVLPVPLPPFVPGVPPVVKNPFGKKGSSDDKPSKEDKKNECKEEKENECDEEGDKDCKEEHEDRDPERPNLSEESSSEEEDKTGEQKTKKKRTLIDRGIHRMKKRLGLISQYNAGTADPVGTEGRTDGVLITDGFQVPAMFSPTGESDLLPNSSSEAGGLEQPMAYKPSIWHTSPTDHYAPLESNNPYLLQSNQPKRAAPPVPKSYRRGSSESPNAHNTRFSGQSTGSGMPPPTSENQYMGIPPPASGSAYMGIPPPTSGSAYMGIPPPTSGSAYMGIPPPTSGSAYMGIPPPTSGSAYIGIPPPTSGSAYMNMPPSTSGSAYMNMPPSTSGSAYMDMPPPTSGSAYMVMPPPTSESVSTPPSKFKPKRSAPPVPSGADKTEAAARRNSGHGLRRQSIGSNTPPSRSGSVHMPSSETKMKRPPQPPSPYASRQKNSHRSSSSNNGTDLCTDPDLNALEQWLLSESDDM